MPKQSRKVDESRELPLFEYVRKAVEASKADEGPEPGSLNIDASLRAAISRDIKECSLSRSKIAAEMSDFTGSEITEAMLNSWTAESKEKHRFPAVYLPAFVLATGGRRAFNVISKAAGLFALPGADALRVEIRKYEEAEKQAKSERLRRERLLNEIEKGGEK